MCDPTLHNIEDERDNPSSMDYEDIDNLAMPRANANHIQAFLEVYRKIEDRASHDQLCEDIIEHQ